ncbi:MAG: phosphoserine phosphatase RsbU/P [Thermoanaerobaculia bacterium]|jgi:serine phosphatase RsbU (regulator of sigma subunit)/pSer/pThr/pTyr-binding forkhead associated (FHA) protein|nr:phosphoserine phosphatase RsbU/P [Thermoanaerobaculia bacterium]
MEPIAPRAEVTVYSPLFSPFRQQLQGSAVSIGRASDCSIPIKDRYLSRKHAEIIAERGAWILKDCGSANGTYLNGSRMERDHPLRTGDRIRLGDTEIVFETAEHNTDRMLAVADTSPNMTISIPVNEIEQPGEQPGGKADTGDLAKLKTLNLLARELIEDRPTEELFGFIVDRVLEHTQASRAALGLLGPDGKSFVNVEVRRQDRTDSSELRISHTVLSEVVEEKKALAFMDVSVDEKLSRAQSIIMQGIRSILCAPLMIGDAVVGVLYVDYLFTQRKIEEDDVRLVAQIARFAAIKLETTRLREEAIQKRIMDEELKTASVIQRGLLPPAPAGIDGYTFSGANRPCRTVSGDYFDFVQRPNGRMYFVIADVSGKGITAGLMMAGLQASFRIFCKNDPTPAELVSQLNDALKDTLPQSKFVTLFLGRLDLATGVIEYANAGHTPPLWLRKDAVEELGDTDLVLGIVTRAEFRAHKLQLAPGDALVLFTDGVTEAEDEDGSDLGSLDHVTTRLAPMHGEDAEALTAAIESVVLDHMGDAPLADDVTLVVVSRNQ